MGVAPRLRPCGSWAPTLERPKPPPLPLADRSPPHRSAISGLLTSTLQSRPGPACCRVAGRRLCDGHCAEPADPGSGALPSLAALRGVEAGCETICRHGPGQLLALDTRQCCCCKSIDPKEGGMDSLTNCVVDTLYVNFSGGRQGARYHKPYLKGSALPSLAEQWADDDAPTSRSA